MKLDFSTQSLLGMPAKYSILTILCKVSCKRGVGTWYEICPRVFVEEAKNKGGKTRREASKAGCAIAIS